MALPTRALSLLFLAIFLLSHHSQARDSQFFSKVSNPKESTTTTTVVIPNNDKKQEQEPNFIPDTQNNGYGLYGHEYGQLPPSETTNANEEQHFTTTTKTYEPYKNQKTFEPGAYDTTPTTYEPYTTPVGPHYGSIETEDQDDQEPANKFRNNAQFYDNNKNNENYYNQNAVKETRNNHNNNNNYNYNGYNAQERQGMSDTRYMENGKYSYPFNSEKQYNPNSYDEKNYDPNTYRNNRAVDYSRNNDNYYNNKYKFYGNRANENLYETNHYNNNNDKNSFEGYQNEEFQEENDNDFEP